MSDRLEEFGSDAVVVLVTFTEAVNIEPYCTVNHVRFPILIDPELSAYNAFGLGRGKILRIWGVRAARRYLELFRANGLRGLRRPTEDTRRLGGDFVIAPDGTLAWGFWGKGPGDRPTVDELLIAVRAATEN